MVRVMHALSKELRLEAFIILCDRVASPKEIADDLGAGLSNVSYHVNVLRSSGMIVLDHTEPRRGAVEHFYKVSAPALDEVRQLAHSLLELQVRAGRQR